MRAELIPTPSLAWVSPSLKKEIPGFLLIGDVETWTANWENKKHVTVIDQIIPIAFGRSLEDSRLPRGSIDFLGIGASCFMRQ